MADRLFTEQQRQVRGVVDLEQHVHELFNADPDVYTASNVKASFWEQQSKEDGMQVLGSVKASFQYNPLREARIAEQVLEQAVTDMKKHTPAPVPFVAPPTKHTHFVEDPCVWVESINDAHLGMLAWRNETGKDDYDLEIAMRDYTNVGNTLNAYAQRYNVEETVVVLGHDMQHIDGLFDKAGRTTAGTPQDFDSRLPKIITAVRRAAVEQIDRAVCRTAEVTVVVVPGNHDRYSMYHLTEVLHAWYRNTPEVTILNAPNGDDTIPRIRQYYQSGENGFMFTHGEGFNRTREPLPLVFADEAPDIWSNTVYREVLCGHQHKTESKGYRRPTHDLQEMRGVRMRALPGLTATDAWHDDQSYRHWRAATGLAYANSGGLLGLHEATP